MAKLIILSVITFVSVNAQFVSERRHNEHDNLRINSDELRVNQEYQQEGLRVNDRSEHKEVGGFQNGNFAQTDGRLRTNLNSGPIVSESSSQNLQPRDSLLVLEEGAAFRRPGNGQYDVHSNLGRNVDVSYAATEDNNPNEKRHSHNLEPLQIGERIDQRTTNNQNANRQVDSRQTGQHADGQGNARNVKSYRNTQGNGNNDRITNSDQATRKIGQNVDNNAQNERNNNQNTFNTHPTYDQENINQYEGRTHSRQYQQNMNTKHDSINNGQNIFNNARTQQTTETNQNKRINTRNSENPEIDSRSSPRANADTLSMNRELNNQITKMIFEESTESRTTLSNTKTTKDNELPSRSSSGKQDDRWIWSDANQMKNLTTTPVPTVDDRAAFAGDQCPTGQVKFNNACVDVD